jgi:hypothetical protein
MNNLENQIIDKGLKSSSLANIAKDVVASNLAILNSTVSTSNANARVNVDVAKLNLLNQPANTENELNDILTNYQNSQSQIGKQILKTRKTAADILNIANTVDPNFKDVLSSMEK